MRLRLRRAEGIDAEGIDRVLAEYGEKFGWTRNVRSSGTGWAWARRGDLAQVLEDLWTGAVVGLVRVWRESDSARAVIRVRPEDQGTGVREALATAAERLARRLSRGEIRLVQPTADTVMASVLRRAGYEATADIVRLRAPLDAAVSPTILPSGIRIDGVDRKRDRTRIRNRFGGAPRSDRMSVDAPFWIAARRGDRVIGWATGCRGREGSTAVGVLDGLDVHADEHGKGIGRGLLTALFTRFAADGLTGAVADVPGEDTTGLAEVCRHAGMHETTNAVEWRKSWGRGRPFLH